MKANSVLFFTSAFALVKLSESDLVVDTLQFLYDVGRRVENHEYVSDAARSTFMEEHGFNDGAMRMLLSNICGAAKRSVRFFQPWMQDPDSVLISHDSETAHIFACKYFLGEEYESVGNSNRVAIAAKAINTCETHIFRQIGSQLWEKQNTEKPIDKPTFEGMIMMVTGFKKCLSKWKEYCLRLENDLVRRKLEVCEYMSLLACKWCDNGFWSAQTGPSNAHPTSQ